METTEKTIDVLNELIELNNDRAAGMERAAGLVDEKNADLRPIFLKMSKESHANSNALGTLVTELGGSPADRTNIKGVVHRAWLSVESVFTGNDRETILSECERGEDEIKKAYQEALANKDQIDAQAATNIGIQAGSIASGYDMIKALRDNARQNQGEQPAGGVNPAGYNGANLDPMKADEDHYGNTENETGLPQPASANANPDALKDQQPVADSKLKEFFVNELKDLLWAEKKLVDTLPKMEEAANTVQLKEAFHSHLAQTEQHVSRLEQIFGVLGEDVDTTKCEAMSGIVDEGEDIIGETEEGTAQRDVGLIFAGQKVEHYEIASYGGMVTLAKTLGLDAAVKLLSQTLAEEKAADQLLTQIAETKVNYHAAAEQE
jgi:uncharacterized protein (TIGR02284 family)